MKKFPYVNALGYLMYVITRPNINYAMGMVSRFQNSSGPIHASYC